MVRVLAFLVGGALGVLVGYHFLLDTLEVVAFRLWREDLKHGLGFIDAETILRASTTWKLVGPMLLFGFAAAMIASLAQPRSKSRKR